jgi:hypothetical protein
MSENRMLNGRYVEAPELVMRCDVHGCLQQVKRAPRICVPATAPSLLMRPVRVMTILHYCEHHRDVFKPAEWLNDANKARMEARAKIARPHGFKLDFEKAYCDMVLVTTPEYRAFLQHIGAHRVIA